MQLVLLTFLPLIGALIVLLTPKSAEKLQRGIALATTLAVAVLGVKLYAGFGDPEGDPSKYLIEVPWFTLPSSYEAPTLVYLRLGQIGRASCRERV